MTAEAAAAEQFKGNQGRKKGHRRREMTSEGRQMRQKDKSRKEPKRNCRLYLPGVQRAVNGLKV